MDDGFEEFSRYHTHSTKEPLVTIQRNGVSITLNRVAYQLLGSPVGATLGYHPQKQYIGILPSDLRTTRGTHINRQGNSETYYVAGKAFTNAYGIPTQKAWRYRAIYEDGMLKVYINGPREEATGPRLSGKSVLGNFEQPTLVETEESELPFEELALPKTLNPDLEAALQKAMQQGLSLDELVNHLHEKYQHWQ